MNLDCCVCGNKVWDKLAEAVDNELAARQEDIPMPIIGVICEPCMGTLRDKGIVK